MAQLDVKDLRNEKLPASKFPVDSRASFRLHIAPEVRLGIQQHAKADASVEICGVLVGNWHADENGPYVAITDYIRCDNASSKFAEVTFTHESWAQINKEMDAQFANSRIVGWYHSHPDFGIFLSERDCFIHENFFSGPGQVAYVFDPVRGLEGMFAWQNGKPTPLPHFWVGNTIRTVEASERNVPAEMAALHSSTNGNASPTGGPSMTPNSSLGFATTVMGLLLMFLLGYYYGGWRSQWERRTVADVAVAYFANPKILRPGLEENLSQVQARLKLVAEELSKSPQPTAAPTKEQSDDEAKRLKVIKDYLILCDAKLAEIAKTYGYSNEERSALLLYLEQMQANIRQQEEARAQSVTAEQASKSQPSATKPATVPPGTTPPNAVPPKTNKAGAAGDAAKNQPGPAPDTGKKVPPSEPAQPKK